MSVLQKNNSSIARYLFCFGGDAGYRAWLGSYFLLALVVHNQLFGQIPEYGRASHYSDRLHGRKTASGARYDRKKMTAAHLHFPFGTKVTVRNLKNNKSVTVVVNDRGPFSKRYCIDLSKAAAKHLGVKGDHENIVTICSMADDSTTLLPPIKQLSWDPSLDTHRVIRALAPGSLYSLTFRPLYKTGYFWEIDQFPNAFAAIPLANAIRLHIDSLELFIKVEQSEEGLRRYHLYLGPIKDKKTRFDLGKKLLDLGLDQIVLKKLP
jgi:rare lipoprotein A